MSAPDYLPLFVAEAREHLQALTLAVVRIEERPDDRETVEEIFRIAHSLKGMSATMGFGAMAALTHQMEDVFELLRQRRDGLGREAIDCLLECLDAIEGDIDSIEHAGEEQLDPAALVRRLKRLVRRRSPEQHHARLGGGDDPEDALARAAGRRTHRLLVRLADDCAMPGVRAYMVLTALATHGELVGSTPTLDGVEHFAGRTIEAFVAGDATGEALAATARAVSDVVEAIVEEEVAPAFEDAPVAGPANDAGGPRPRTSTVRIDTDRLDQLMQHISELVVHRTRLESLASAADVPGMEQAMQGLTETMQQLQAVTMQMRMIPIANVFLRFPRLVRDVSARLDKQVELVLVGTDTELDRTVVEALGEPLVHLVRNALDHGLETPERRLAIGKPPTGTLEISASHSGADAVITVRDDGRGIAPDRVAAKAVAAGLLDAEAAASLDADAAAELLFAPGLSTATTISDISGRGVGMDAVRTAVRALGGEVTLSSAPDQGTTVRLRLPIKVAVVAALEVEVHGLSCAIPLDRIERTLRLADHPVRSIGHARMLNVRDGSVPVIDAAQALGHAASGGQELAVIVHGAHGRVALAVDRLVGRRDVVIRPAASRPGDGVPVSSTAILEDGAIVPVVDCDAVCELLRHGPALAA